jgi:hypothetical protein
MKKSLLFLFWITISLRLLVIVFIKTDPLFYLSPRNFNGRGLMTMPVLLDFLIPVLVIILLWKNQRKFSFHAGNIRMVLPGLLVWVVPAITGFVLSHYIQQTYVAFSFGLINFSRYLLFLLTFYAINLFADNLEISGKFHRRMVLFIFIFFIAFAQDVFGKSNTMFLFMALLSSVGAVTALIAIAMRRFYKKYPVETFAVVSFMGIFIIFFIYNVRSTSFFTILLPSAAMYLIAFLLYCNCKRSFKIALMLTPVIVALFLNYGLQFMLSPEQANEIIGTGSSGKMYEEQVGSVKVEYRNRKVRSIAIKLAKVIDAANKVSEQTFGVSPQVDELVISGFGYGGFHAEFPHRIVGKIISEKYIKSCADSALLNNPDLTPNFPDPVNAVLHEYCHLFGGVPYFQWMPGAEEEGWATFGATRMSLLLYSHYGKNLWSPAYNYAAQADKITQLNLSGKAVAWSHPNEFGGFKLWYRLYKDVGLRTLFRKRWTVTRRNLRGSLLLESHPDKARKVALTFGLKRFRLYGQAKAFRFGERYSLSDYSPLSKLAGVNEAMINNLFAMLKGRTISPAVIVP